MGQACYGHGKSAPGLKISVSQSVSPLEVGVDVLPLVVQIRPDEPSKILTLSAVEVSHAPQSVCAKDNAP